jgi:hypothetical protein
MALYVPLSRRRRNAALVAIATLIAGLVVGVLVGRSSATTAQEAAREVRAKADTLATRLEALTIEYQQAVSGGGDTVQGGVLAALDLIEGDLPDLFGDAPWLGAAQRSSVTTAVQAVRDAATQTVSVDSFATTVDTSAKTIRATFGFDG